MSSTHLPANPYSGLVKPVALPPGRARFATKPAPTGSTACANTIGTVRVACSKGVAAGMPLAKTTSGESATNSAACLRKLSASPPPQRRSIRTLRPTAQPASCNRRETRLSFRVVRGEIHEHADAAHTLALLRARRQRPRRRATEQRDELAPATHSSTSSVRASRPGGTSMPSAIAVARLITRSNFVDCTTGRSAGFSPLRMRPV